MIRKRYTLIIILPVTLMLIAAINDYAFWLAWHKTFNFQPFNLYMLPGITSAATFGLIVAVAIISIMKFLEKKI